MMLRYIAATSMIAITAATLFTPLERIDQPLLLVEDGSIVEVTSRVRRELPRTCRAVDFGDGILAPGFVDIHIHGGTMSWNRVPTRCRRWNALSPDTA